VLKLGTVLVGLPAEDVSEDGNDQIVGVVSGGLDNGVNEEEFNSDIFEAVWGEEEGNTVPFDNVSDLDSWLVGLAFVEHFLSFLHKGEDFNEEVKILALNEGIGTVLSS